MLVRCGALWRRRRGAPSWLLRDPDTGGLPALDIDYSGGRAFKAGSVVDLAGLHTVSRASGGVATDAYALGDKTSLAVGSQSTGAFSFYGYIRRLTYFDRRISNAGLQALTA